MPPDCRQLAETRALTAALPLPAQKDVKKFVEEVKAGGGNAELYLYQGEAHAFMNAKPDSIERMESAPLASHTLSWRMPIPVASKFWMRPPLCMSLALRWHLAAGRMLCIPYVVHARSASQSWICLVQLPASPQAARRTADWPGGVSLTSSRLTWGDCPRLVGAHPGWPGRSNRVTCTCWCMV